MTGLTATYIDTETDMADGTERAWYIVHGIGVDGDNGEYAVTSDGRILDVDGKPLTDGDAETEAVRRAINKA